MFLSGAKAILGRMKVTSYKFGGKGNLGRDISGLRTEVAVLICTIADVLLSK